ncbi:MAG: hypothetical protein H0Z28_02050 [Archaeoglobus sp.]|nr:hypothetical protein [Archaeoglobus sp.]
MPELQQLNKHLIVKSKKAIVVAEISGESILNVYCDYRERCNEAGLTNNGCPPYCEFIVAIKRYLCRQPTKFSIKEL